MDLWLWRVVVVLLAAISLLGLLNGLVFRVHGPAFDLFIVAGALALGTYYFTRRIVRDR